MLPRSPLSEVAGHRRQLGGDRIPHLSLVKPVLTGVQSRAESAQAISASSSVAWGIERTRLDVIDDGRL